MQVSYIREFIVFASYMNFTKAAKELFISQPTMVNHIASMESDLGFPLIDRKSGKPELTHRGHTFLKGIQPIADEFEALIRTCREEAYVHLNVPRFVFGYDRIFAEAIERCESENSLQADLGRVDCYGEDATAIVSDGTVDVAILVLPYVAGQTTPGLPWKDVCMRELFDDRLGIWVKSDNPLGESRHIRLEELEGAVFPTVGRPANTAFVKAIQSFLEQRNIHTQYRIVGLQMPQTELRFFDIGNMVGISNMSWLTQSFDEIDAFRIVEIDDCPLRLKVCMVYKQDLLDEEQLYLIDLITSKMAVAPKTEAGTGLV